MSEVTDSNSVDETEEESQCQKPCDPAVGCEECAEYWQRMQEEGYWVDGQGWTNKAMREMTK
jgi:hypothetical protein